MWRHPGHRPKTSRSWWCAPEETDVAGSDADLGSALLAQLQTANALVVEPYADDLGDVPLLANLPEPGSITAEENIDSIDAVKWTLSNGITVIAKQTDFRDDEVLFRAFSPGGHSLVTDEDHQSRDPRRSARGRKRRRSA